VLLRTLYLAGPASRQELGGMTGLSAGTVSNVTADLLTDGVIVEAGLVESDGGRPRVLLRVDPEYGFAIGADVGETHVRVQLYDLDMNERATASYALRPATHGPELIVRHLLAGIDTVLAEADVSPSRVLGVGVGVPGIVERGEDAAVHAQTFGWDGVPLGTMLRAGTSLPLFIDNGAKTLGQAELWFGSGRGADHLAVVLMGSGVGASIITDGAIYRGANSSAGEWGHIKIALGGRECRCGGRGCLEAYIGAEAILERAGIAYATAGEEAALTGLVEEGTSPVLEEAVAYLGAGLANLINLFNPERIVISGWAGLLLGHHLLPRIIKAAEQNALAQPYATTSIVLGRLGPDAVALGAAILVIEEFLNNDRISV
jgi:predicted NBD/HSP70 family sugar kinase